jgi:hypothetical protein
MIWSDLRGNTESQAETSWPPIENGSAVTKVNGPKVKSMLALVKSGYLLEGLSIPRYGNRKVLVKMRWVQITSRKGQREGKISLESSETVRQIPTSVWVGKDTVRTAWRHAEGGRNDHSSSHLVKE